MFDDDLFDAWLDKKSKDIFVQLGDDKTPSGEEMIILVLKAQTNHFAHLDRDLREEMLELRKDMDRRFEQVDKRFEQVDKRFEQVDKRFEALATRIDRFMMWSFATTVSVGALTVAAIKMFPGHN